MSEDPKATPAGEQPKSTSAGEQPNAASAGEQSKPTPVLEHPNATLVRELFRAFRENDLAAIERVVPDHAVWEFPGRRGKIAGRHEGRTGILGFLMNVMALTEGTFHLDLEDVVAGDRHAVALFRGHGRRGDKILDNPTCLRMRIEDGRVVEIREFVWDLFEVDEFWS